MSESATETDRLAYYLLKRVNQAVRTYTLIEDGDRIAVAVSGGKDSLTLLRLLQLYRRRAGVRYELMAMHVRVPDDPDEEERSRALVSLFESWGVPYRVLEMDLTPDEPRPLPCHRCTWHRRKALFIAADEAGCRAVAYGHHRDDRATTALLGLFFAGRLESLPARRDFFGGRIRLIRPLILAPEKEISRFARASDFPDLGYHCPQAQRSRRAFVKEVLRIVYGENPKVVANVINAVEEVERLRLQDAGKGSS